MNPLKLLPVLCASALLAGLPAVAKDKNSKQLSSPKAAAQALPACAPTQELNSKGARQEPWVDVRWQFSDQERATVQAYSQSYGGKGRGKARQLPPGLAKKVARGGELPPGWQQKCVVGQTMPPEVFEQCRPLPHDLVAQLPPPPEPTITVAIGGRVVRLLQATREILDVFDVHVRL